MCLLDLVHLSVMELTRDDDSRHCGFSSLSASLVLKCRRGELAEIFQVSSLPSLQVVKCTRLAYKLTFAISLVEPIRRSTTYMGMLTCYE